MKPRRSAGGFAIHDYAGQSFNPRTHFLQERIAGVPCSAVFLGQESATLMLGVTQQLIGAPWLNATGFHYAGSVGPLPLDSATVARWQHLGAVLTQTFHLRGLYGVDAILRDGVPWPVEINPRYTASMELLERAYHHPLFGLHRAVFERTPLPTSKQSTTPAIWGKAILYARETVAFPAGGPWLDGLIDGVDLDATEYADIPRAGEIIERGRPVLTLFASAATGADCLTKLQEKAQALDWRLWG